MNNQFTITGNTHTLCLIGHPVSHSFSPIMHNAQIKELGLDYVYTAYDVHPDNLEKAVIGFKALNIKGINVTIPHKENIMQYLDEIDPIAKKIGSINTIKNEDGFLIARNTDVAGAKKALLDVGCSVPGKKILVLGAGGVARALCFILAEEAEQIILTDLVEDRVMNLAKEVRKKMDVDIKGKISNNLMIKEEIENTDILINATPIGMHPKIDKSPISKEFLHKNLFVFDVVYNPLKTKLMKDASEIGCKILGGLDMLINQGALGFEWWTNKKPNINLMKNKIIEFLGIN